MPSSTFDLTDKVCLVSGAVEGIGWNAAQIMAQRGGHVILAGRVADDRLERRVKELTDAGFSAEGLACNVTVAKEVQACFQSIFKAHRKLDVCVANAGVLNDARLGMISEDLIDETMQVNLNGCIRVIQGAARLMARAKSGSIIATTSIIGTNGNVGQVVYGASKAGVIGAVKSAAKEMAPSNVRVNGIAPGYINTRMISHLDADVHAERVAQIGMQRVGEPAEVAEAIAFLASDAASYITGQILGVDGGMVI